MPILNICQLFFNPNQTKISKLAPSTLPKLHSPLTSLNLVCESYIDKLQGYFALGITSCHILTPNTLLVS
ncbi:hypothetical protein B6N60_00203 [Richelia sinica FACHB-800]|uniref:Uncharacterized protein n=1 Tax=Richelia sinica FACHB-800 TaxID=1357546 RepID=A0A975T4Z0_9NOST|nr:hypothetical protein B6N60_00203 [Richelia sinica FACHB-800]